MPLTDSSRIGLANRFAVDVGGRWNLGSWSKVSGLDVTWDIAEYRAGDLGNHRWLYPGATKYSDVVLERAACEDSTRVQQMLSDQSFKDQSTLPWTIKLYDSTGQSPAIASWTLRGAFPKKWSIGQLQSGTSTVALETLTIVHVGFLNDDFRVGA